ncbi:hypothetical protein [Candidatus Villigracilis affinis]|uniref:hypothetical protein n=1 Tax=Candidatus Villigracilis affinis TaxID=3140682 RepID=UPI002A20F5E4|nr:hypothetical protein [Anaerolineales bacterium]
MPLTKFTHGRHLSISLRLKITIWSSFALSQSIVPSQTFMFDQLETLFQAITARHIAIETQNAEETFSEIVEEIGKLAEYQATLYTQSPTLGQGTYWDANTQLTIRSGDR